jgi:hypothetical protein
MAIGFGQPTPEEEALQDPDVQPSDAWNIPKGLAALGAMAPAAIIKLFHGTAKPWATAIDAHGFDPARIGSGADAGTPVQGWYGKSASYWTPDEKVAGRAYGGQAQTSFEMQNPQLRPTGGGKVPGGQNPDGTDQYSGLGYRNARVLETEVDDMDILDVTQEPYKTFYNQKLAGIMTGTPTDGRDFIMRRQQWAQGILDDAVQQYKYKGVKFGQNEVVIPDPTGLSLKVKKVR